MKLGRRLLAVVLVSASFVVGMPSAEAAPKASIYELGVTGLIDPINASFIRSEIGAAEKAHADVVVIQLDSSRSVLSETQLDQLVTRIKTAKVPVTVWIGGVGARARRGPYRLVQAADFVGAAPGTAIGPGPKSARDAYDDGTVDVLAATLGDFVVNLDGVTLDGTKLSTARVVQARNQPRRQPTTSIRLAKLDLLDGLLHTAASPAVAYLFLMGGLLLIMFEFFTVGVGVASITGTFLLVPAFYGLAVLPTNPIGLALLVLAVLAFAVDVQVGIPRFWTAVGTVALLVGSFTLYDGLTIPWFSLLAISALTMVIVLTGMPSIVRSRFSTPTVGREWLIGMKGLATSAVAPDGTVQVSGAPWRARTNRATPIGAGDDIVVSGLDGLILEVDPAEGAARDYREPRE